MSTHDERRFSWEDDLIEHFLVNTFQCMICGEKFLNKKSFSLHVKNHEEFKRKMKEMTEEESIQPEDNFPALVEGQMISQTTGNLFKADEMTKLDLFHLS